MPSRSAWTWAMYHQARTWSSSLMAARNDSSLRLPRVGARTWASATASRGGFRCGPSAAGVGTRSLSSFLRPLPSLLIVRPTLAAGPTDLTADRPGTGARLRVEQRRPVVLLVLGSGCGVAAAADRFPG